MICTNTYMTFKFIEKRQETFKIVLLSSSPTSEIILPAHFETETAPSEQLFFIVLDVFGIFQSYFGWQL